MAYDTKLAERLNIELLKVPNLTIEIKKMFRGLTFMVNGKMCISVSGQNLMCRFDPDLEEDVSQQKGFKTMVMRGKTYKGYCYVLPVGFESAKDFHYWINLCLSYNGRAKASKKRK